MGKTASTIRTSHFNEMQPGNCNNLTVVQGKGVILLKCNQEIIVIILLLSTEKGILPVYRFLQLYPTIHWNSNDREMKTTE